jgi:hypothetical protein
VNNKILIWSMIFLGYHAVSHVIIKVLTDPAISILGAYLKREATGLSKTLVTTHRSTKYHNLEDHK